ncbi:MAG: DUF1554 domain-containing protein [Burkholderiales bacterium]|nr:DUF1554 domain-containing protein [Burkholderiales bacterium]
MRYKSLPFRVSLVGVFALLALNLTACNSGSTTSYVYKPSGVLASYVNRLDYESATVLPTANQQQLLISAPTTLTSMRAVFYADESCASGVEVITANGLANLQKGSYATTSASNLLLCQNFGMPYFSGCDGLANAALAGKVKSFRFFYYYQNSSTSNPSFSQCLTNPQRGYEAPLNYTTNPPSGCAESSSCSLSQAYTYNLQPSAYNHQIFISSNSYDGKLGGFAGADEKCNSAANKPALPANLRYKALLNGNMATVFGVNYYNLNQQLIATATGGNLDSVNNLINPIGAIADVDAWTGADGAYNCNNWMDNSSNIFGEYGFTEKTNLLWFSGSFAACNNNLHLYCVAQ